LNQTTDKEQKMATQIMNQEQQKQEQQINRGEFTRDVTTYVPRVDILENEDEIVLYADMPGVDSESLDIQFEDRQLTIHGKVDWRHSEMNFVGGEYGVGDFYRTFTIGETIDPEKISAEIKNGVLKLHLPKAEAAKPRKITVKAG
jgi:HSP20 family molecular chaperone IbpA